MNFKVEIKAVGENNFHSNDLVFGTKAEAERYGGDLYSRWTMVEEWRVVEIDKPVTCAWDFEENTYYFTGKV
jgi:hypothetical protein